MHESEHSSEVHMCALESYGQSITMYELEHGGRMHVYAPRLHDAGGQRIVKCTCVHYRAMVASMACRRRRKCKCAHQRVAVGSGAYVMSEHGRGVHMYKPRSYLYVSNYARTWSMQQIAGQKESSTRVNRTRERSKSDHGGGVHRCVLYSHGLTEGIRRSEQGGKADMYILE